MPKIHISEIQNIRTPINRTCFYVVCSVLDIYIVSPFSSKLVRSEMYLN